MAQNFLQKKICSNNNLSVGKTFPLGFTGWKHWSNNSIHILNSYYESGIIYFIFFSQPSGEIINNFSIHLYRGKNWDSEKQGNTPIFTLPVINGTSQDRVRLCDEYLVEIHCSYWSPEFSATLALCWEGTHVYEALDGREFLTPIVRNMTQFSGFFPGDDGSRVEHCSIIS